MSESHVEQIRIFISSTRADLYEYRLEAARIIEKVRQEKERYVQLRVVAMEREVQNGEREFPIAVSKRWVDESDWVVLIVGFHYGTISDEDGSRGISVTEAEFRYAVELGKKTFVFIAGDPNTADRYRASKEEEEDLKDWIPRQTPLMAEKLSAFKSDLRQYFVGPFANLPAFRERLEWTLKQNIDNLLPVIQPGTQLADLIVAVRPNVHACVVKVAQVANCKRIHDYLHDLRHRVIRPLHDEVVAVWIEQGTLSLAREKVIWRCLANRAEAMGGLRAARPLIGLDHQGLRDSVDAVLRRRPFWNIEAEAVDERPSLEDFTEEVDEWAAEVQEAFSEADRSMAKEESDLRERYAALLDELKRARQQKQLGQADLQRLDDELDKVDANRTRMKNLLTSHHRWQEAHDKLVEMDSFRERSEFERKLNHYRGTSLGKLLSLLDEELEATQPAGRDSLQTPEQAAGETLCGRASAAQTAEGLREGLVDDLRAMRAGLETLRLTVAASAFDSMRKPFESAFYWVDKRTLNEVERAHERVLRIEDWLDRLAAEQGQRA